MVTLTHNIDRVLASLQKARAAIVQGHRAALSADHWKSRAVDVARVTLESVALPGDRASIDGFLGGIGIIPSETGFTLRLAPNIDPDDAARGLDIRGTSGLPLFAGAFARTQQESWDIIRDWVEFAKDLDERDEDADGVVDFDQVATKIHRILFYPSTDAMVSARERLLRRGNRGAGRGMYLMDFAAGMTGAGAYQPVGVATAKAWLRAIGNAWVVMIRQELPSVMYAQIHKALKEANA